MAEKEKVFGKPIQCKHFLYRGNRGQWYPRSVAEELVEKQKKRWDEDGVDYEEVSKEEMVNRGAELDLGKDLSNDE